MNLLRLSVLLGNLVLLAACSSPFETCTRGLPQDALPESLWLYSQGSSLSDEQLLACEEALSGEQSAKELERILYALGTRRANDVRAKGGDGYYGTRAADLYISAFNQMQEAIDTLAADSSDADNVQLAHNIWNWSRVLDRNLETSMLFLRHSSVQPAEESHPETLQNARTAEWAPARLYAMHEYSHQEERPALSADEREWLLGEAVVADPRVALHTALEYDLLPDGIASMGRQALTGSYDREIWGVTAIALYTHARERSFEAPAVNAALDFMRAYPEPEATLPKAAALRWGCAGTYSRWQQLPRAGIVPDRR